jgi:hypothetical protein
MTKPVQLGRLSDISRQRSIRRPLLVVVPTERDEHPPEVPDTLAEWPLPR